MKTIIFPKHIHHTLKDKFILSPLLGYYKPHQIIHVLTHKRQPTNLYIKIIHIQIVKDKPNLIEKIFFKQIFEDNTEIINHKRANRILN